MTRTDDRGRGRAVTARPATLATLTEQLGSVQEARWILDHAGDRWPELVERRLAGEPLQYVLGSWPFRHLDLMVDRRVLIPRPETEQVVEVALAELDRLCWPSEPDVAAPADESRLAARRVCVDLGTGSGAIALSLATEGTAIGRDLEVWATDISADALAVAGHNLAALAASPEVAPVHLMEGSWFAALPPGLAGRIDLLVTNPPYVPEADIAGLDPVVRDWEPLGALAAGPGPDGVGGMAAIQVIIEAAPAWLGPDGAMVI
ncbi:MAG: HemK/PrmC family methyltransferase, partial [Acidimicrobiales bacterium]